MSIPVTVPLDEETVRSLDRIAAEGATTREALVGEALQDMIALRTRQSALIRQGIEAADAGDFAGEDEIAAIQRKFAARR